MMYRHLAQFFLFAAFVTVGVEQAQACDPNQGENCGIDSSVYLDVLNYSCGNAHVTDAGAQRLGEMAAKSRIDISVFKRAYDATCDFDSAVRIGTETVSGGINPNVYEEMLNYSCGSAHITDTGATEIAELAARGSINVSTFKSVYYRTCNFDSAKEVACVQRVGDLDLNRLLGSATDRSGESKVSSGRSSKPEHIQVAGDPNGQVIGAAAQAAL